jgi:hypothetical protein
MAYPSIKLGRLTLAELPQNPAVEAIGQGAAQPPQRLLRINGQEGTAANLTQASLAALHDDIQGLVAGDYLVPVTFGDKSDRNAFYRVAAAQNTEQGWGSESRTDAWQIDLERVGSQWEIDFESRVTGATTVGNDFSLTGNQWCSPPSGAFAFSPDNNLLTRECSDGPAQTVYLTTASATSYRWGCAVANYNNGRARFLDENGAERSGLNFSVGSLTGWTLTNGIVRVTPGATGAALDIAAWTNGAWNIRGWNFFATGGVGIGGWSSVNLLRNDYEMVVVRLLKDILGGTGRATLDLTLRRGSRFVEVYLAADSAQNWSIARQNSSIGVSATGTLTARDEDSAGNKWTIGSARTFTADTANGAISVTGKTTMDAYIGAVVGGDLLNSNPDFETGISPWGNQVGCTFAQSNTRAQNGSFSALMTPDGVTASIHAESEQEPVTVGQSYQVSGWVWPTATITGNIGLSVNWYNASHTLISTTTNTVSATAGQWNFLTATSYTAPAGAAYAAIVPTIGGTPAASNLVWWDQLKLRTIVSSLDSASQLLAQYAGRKAESVQPVRR